MPLGTEVGLGPCDVVLDGVAAPPERGIAPQFSVYVYCGQTAGWKVQKQSDLGPGHIVLDGDPASPHERGTAASPFRPVFIVATVAHRSYC